MTTHPKPQQRSRKEPRFLHLARTFYGEAFGVRRVRELSAAMADWSELTEDEQSFTLAHLHYLGLLAQARTQKLLLQVRDLLDEVAEGLEEPEDDDEDGSEELPPEPEDFDDDALDPLPPEPEVSPERDDEPGDDAGGEE